MNCALDSVAVDIDSDESIGWNGTNVKFLAKEFHHLIEDCLGAAENESVVDVKDENSDFFIRLPFTKMTIIHAWVSYASCESKKDEEFVEFDVPYSGSLF
jgi:hypothetical protein